MPTVDGTQLYHDAIEKINRYRNALQNIAELWPIETTARIGPDYVSGVNDGRSRAIIAECAVTIARKALGIEKMP